MPNSTRNLICRKPYGYEMSLLCPEQPLYLVYQLFCFFKIRPDIFLRPFKKVIVVPALAHVKQTGQQSYQYDSILFDILVKRSEASLHPLFQGIQSRTEYFSKAPAQFYNRESNLVKILVFHPFLVKQDQYVPVGILPCVTSCPGAVKHSPRTRCNSAQRHSYPVQYFFFARFHVHKCR